MITIAINYWAILACGVVSMILGFLWYGTLFGKKYMQLQGVTEAEVERYKKDPKMQSKMMRSYVFTFILALLTAFVLDHTIVFVGAFMQLSALFAVLATVVAVWIGFVAPATTNLVFFDKKNWEWWFLVNGYYLVQLVLMGIILVMWM